MRPPYLRAGLCALALGVLLMPSNARAQAAAASPTVKDSTAANGSSDMKLVYDREVFSYPAVNRRDPFKPLVGPNGDSMGPRFQDLSLRGIIFSPLPDQSVALLEDASGKVYRVKRGDLVGNARVMAILPLKVNFDVEAFGSRRAASLELKHAVITGGQP